MKPKIPLYISKVHRKGTVKRAGKNPQPKDIGLRSNWSTIVNAGKRWGRIADRAARQRKLGL